MEKGKQTYKLPEGWIWSNIQELFIIIGGGTPSKKHNQFWGGTINWASVKDIKSQYLIETIDKITEEGIKNSNTNIANIDDIIFVTRISPGQISIAKNKIAINQDLKIFKRFGGISSLFVYYLLKSRKHQFQSNASGTTVKGLRLSNLNNIHLPIPPLKEQQRIVVKLEELYSKIDHAEIGLKKAKHQLEVYRHSLLKSVFTENFSKELRIEEVSEFIGSGSTPRGGRNVYQENGIPFIRSQNVHSNCLVQNDLVFISKEVNEKMKRTQTQPKDVLLNITGASIGRCAFIPENFEKGNVNQHVCIIRVLPEYINYKYLTYFLNSPVIQSLINRINSGATREALNLTQIKNINLPICSIEEQVQIVYHLDSRFTLINNLEESIEKELLNLEKSKYSILSEAFKGNLVPQDINNDSALVLLNQIKIEKEIYLKKVKTQKMNTLSNNKNINKKTALLELIREKYTHKEFSFEEIRKLSDKPYEDLKAELYLLLDKNKELEIVFNKSNKKIFYKIKS